MTAVIDTNVIAVANDREADHASPECVLRCVQRLLEIRESARIALDSSAAILLEYLRHANRSGETGAGDGFLKWVLIHQWDGTHCDLINITPLEDGSYREFPDDPRLAAFHLNDRKFVAVSMAHPEKPPILNAVDSDWDQFNSPLAEHGVKVEGLCPSVG